MCTARPDWIVINDDIEDGSSQRCDRATLHAQYSVPLALNARDALHVLMWQVFMVNIIFINPYLTLSDDG